MILPEYILGDFIGYSERADTPITVKGDKLYRGDKRHLIVGVNITKDGVFPSKEDAKRVAQRLSYFGVHEVRLQQQDQPEPKGILTTWPSIGTDKIDLLENFINELKNAGIYVNLSLYSIAAEMGVSKRTAAVMFMPDAKANYKAYYNTLLTRVNKYTGLMWGEDPCVSIIEIINEHGLLDDFFKGVEYTTEQNNQLKAQWNAYTGETGEPLTLTTYNASTDTVRAQWVEFLTQLEIDFITEIKQFINEHSNALIVAGQVNYMSNHAAAIGDIIDRHIYYDRPTVGETWKQLNKPITQSGSATLSAWGDGACSQHKGKPFTISEANYGGFNFYGAEQMIFFFSQMAYQDMDGIHFFNYVNAPYYDTRRLVGDLVFDKNPAKMINMKLMGHAFKNEHIRPAISEVNEVISRATHTSKVIGYTVGQQDVKISRNADGIGTGYSQSRLLVERLYSSTGEDDIPAFKPGIDLTNAVSDTGEITFKDRGEYIVRTEKTKAYAGYVGYINLGHGVSVILPTDAYNGWYSFVMTECEGRHLISQFGVCADSGMEFISDTELESWGDGAVILDVKETELYLPQKEALFTPIDENGNALPSVKSEPYKNGCMIRINAAYGELI